jgi:hypothetical protein
MMASHHFCTLFDRNYLIKGVVMLRSLMEQCPEAEAYVLCMDPVVEEVLGKLALRRVHLIPLAQIEDEALLSIKASRGTGEYCWTLSPCLPLALMKANPQIQQVTYLDADLMFFSPLEPLFEEIGGASITVVEHRFTPALRSYRVNGRFCVEWVGFRRDAEGIACLERWREQCLEWCFYRLEEGRMGDQKYLDEWPDRYRSVHVMRHLGAGVAPWNFDQYAFGEDELGRITVDRQPLIFFHFHLFEMLEDESFVRLPAYCDPKVAAPDRVYKEYEARLKEALVEIRRVKPGFRHGIRSSASVVARRVAQRWLPGWAKSFLRRFIRY